MRVRNSIGLGVFVAACVVVISIAGEARAQEGKSVKKVEDMNRAAMEDYDLLEFESAKKQLNEALVLIKKNKLEKHAVAAKTHMNLGIVYGGGLQDADTALLEFIAAVEIDAAIALDPAYKNKQLQALYDQARSTAGVGKGGEPALDEVKGLVHSPIDEAPAGSNLDVSVQVGADVKAKQVILYYRGQGAEDFTPVAMKSTGGPNYVGAIPGDVVGGDSLHYYIEAKNAAGKVTATAGNAGSPNIVIVVGAAASGGTGDGEDEEKPDILGGGPKGGDDGPAGDGPTTIKGGPKSGKKSVFLTVAVGSGGGFVTGETEVSKQSVGCCVAPALFHVQPEIGFWLNPRLTLSAYGRLGFTIGVDVQGDNVQKRAMAPAAFLRLGYAMNKKGGAGVYVHGDVGGGIITHNIPLKKDEAAMASIEGSTDSAASGPLFLGGGASWVKPLGGSLRFVADANTILGIPVVSELGTSKMGFSIHVDLNLGLQLAF